ncbi:MAG: hypothetical protein ACXIVD_17295 [Salinarimonas sp.]
MELFWIFIIGAGVYFLVKGNTNRGIETVRASVFLGGMQAGVTVSEANYVASFDMLNASREIIQNTKNHLRNEYGGKQLLMISDAYSQGMIPKLPYLYRLISGLQTNNLPLGQNYSTHEATSRLMPEGQSPAWVRPFVLYFVASEFMYALSGELPNTVRELIHDGPSGGTQQSMLVQLQTYLQHAHGRDRQQDDLRIAVADAGVFLRGELRTLNSTFALKQFLRRLQTKDGSPPLSEYELEKQTADIVAKIKSNEDAARVARIAMLKEIVERRFETAHRKTITAYMRDFRV